MRTGRTPAAVGLVGLAGLLLVWFGPRPPDVARAISHPIAWASAVGPDRAALAVAGSCSWLVLFWLVTGLALTVLAALPGAVGVVADALANCLLPAAVRRAAVGLLGLSLTAAAAGCGGGDSSIPPAAGGGPPLIAATALPGLAAAVAAEHGTTVDWPVGTPVPTVGATTQAAPSTTPRQPTPPGRPPTPVGGPPTPTQATRPAAPAARPAPERPSAPPSPGDGRLAAPASGTRPAGPVTVRPGDCLWSIASRRLGPEATAAQVAVEANRWYVTNAATIGTDPDFLRPGEVLSPPAFDTST
jgi:hypothetical protein